jgi:hypothetical protein
MFTQKVWYICCVLNMTSLRRFEVLEIDLCKILYFYILKIIVFEKKRNDEMGIGKCSVIITLLNLKKFGYFL